MTTYDHDPSARLDYSQDWTPWLTDAADTITTAVWTCSDPTTVLEPVTGSAAAGKPRVFVSLVPATADIVTITCHITTAAGRQDDRTDRLRIQQR